MRADLETGGGELFDAGVGNYLTPPLGNCLTLEGFSLGNYLIADTHGKRGEAAYGSMPLLAMVASDQAELHDLDLGGIAISERSLDQISEPGDERPQDRIVRGQPFRPVGREACLVRRKRIPHGGIIDQREDRRRQEVTELGGEDRRCHVLDLRDERRKRRHPGPFEAHDVAAEIGFDGERPCPRQGRESLPRTRGQECAPSRTSGSPCPQHGQEVRPHASPKAPCGLASAMIR